MAAEYQNHELPSERIVGGVLPRTLRTRDLVVIFVAVVLFATNGSTMQSAGPAAFAWWIIGFACFLIPAAVVTAFLGRTFPGEGSIYLWTHKAFGSFGAFFATFCIWWPMVLTMPATGSAALGFLGYIFPGTVGALNIEMQGLVIIVAVLVMAFLSTLRNRVTQNIVNVFIALYLVAIFLVFLAGVVHQLSGARAEVDPTAWPAYHPSSPSGVNTGNWSFPGVVILAMLGIEVPPIMGAEIRRVRSVARHLAWGTLTVMVAYLALTWAVMVTVPPDQARSSVVTPLTDAVAISFGKTAVTVVALLFAAGYFFIGVVYNYVAARLLFVAGLDEALPRSITPSDITTTNRNRVPSTAMWTQIGIVVGVTAIVFIILPVLGITGSPTDVQTEVFDTLQAGVTIIWSVSMIVLFVDAVVIRRRHPNLLAGSFLARRGLLWTCGVVGIATSVMAVVTTLSTSWTTLISNDDAHLTLWGATVSWGSWSWSVIGIVVFSLGAAGVIYLIGHRERRTNPPPTGQLPADRGVRT